MAKLNEERYARQIKLPQIGLEGQKRLLSAKVLIVGAGGLGSPAALYLAGAGIGTIGIADGDNVELVNLHRQIIHKVDSIGTPKTASAANGIRSLNNEIVVNVHNERITRENAERIFRGYDIVLDAPDNFPTRYVVNQACLRLGIPVVEGAILRMAGQLSVFDPKNGGPCYSCIYPEPPPTEIAPPGTEAGILGMIPGIIGTMQALEVVKLVARFGEPLIGRLLIFDGLTGKINLLEIKRDPKCGVCGT